MIIPTEYTFISKVKNDRDNVWIFKAIMMDYFRIFQKFMAT